MGKKKTIPQAFADIRNDYEMSRDSRFVRKRTSLPTNGGGADYHYRTETNDAIIGQLVDRVVANVIQDGFGVTPNTGDRAINDALWYRWKEWADSPDECDLGGEMCFHDFERLAFRASVIDGDGMVYITNTGALQFWEAEGQTRAGGRDPSSKHEGDAASLPGVQPSASEHDSRRDGVGSGVLHRWYVRGHQLC